MIIMSADAFNFGPLSSDSSTCLGSIVSSMQNDNIWTFGTSFLRDIYTIFDYDNNQVGLADLKWLF